MLGGAGRTKEWNDKGRQKWRDTLTKKAPYKPDAGNRHVRCDERDGKQSVGRRPQATAPILDSTNSAFAASYPGRRLSGDKLPTRAEPGNAT
jgi:hypothetical protein